MRDLIYFTLQNECVNMSEDLIEELKFGQN